MAVSKENVLAGDRATDFIGEHADRHGDIDAGDKGGDSGEIDAEVGDGGFYGFNKLGGEGRSGVFLVGHILG